jgi:hypothetical protein
MQGHSPKTMKSYNLAIKECKIDIKIQEELVIDSCEKKIIKDRIFRPIINRTDSSCFPVFLFRKKK